jgi:hypothetical protein
MRRRGSIVAVAFALDKCDGQAPVLREEIAMSVC